MSGMILASAIPSVLLVLVACGAARFGWQGAIAVGAAVFACFVWAFMLFVSVVLFFHAVIMAGLTFVWLCAGRRPMLLRVFALLSPLWPYGSAYFDLEAQRGKVEQVRAEFPIVSVVERLAYEKPAAARAAAGDEVAAIHLAPAVERGLNEQEKLQEQNEWRIDKYRRLHTHFYDSFVVSQGFGGQRMMHMYRFDDERRDSVAPIEMPMPSPRPRNDGTPSDGATSAEPPPVANEQPLAPDLIAVRGGPRAADLSDYHMASMRQFVVPDRLGYIESREHIVGFEPHRFERLPELTRFGAADNSWLLARLELVSLLKHPEPRVYVSAHLPRMDELTNAPTRPLNAFENRSLPRLRTSEDLVVDEATNSVRMLGAVRAGTTCLKCHSVARGELLGAFTYELRRTKPMPEPKAKPPSDAEL